MALEDKEISRLILDSFFSRFKRMLICDVAVVGAGPAGMAANAVWGGHRMGPIFGGMILFGEKVVQLIIKKLKKGKKR